jgi:hypothetical protein
MRLCPAGTYERDLGRTWHARAGLVASIVMELSSILGSSWLSCALLLLGWVRTEYLWAASIGCFY